MTSRMTAVHDHVRSLALFFYNKTIIGFGFVISRMIKVSVSVIRLSLRLRLITPTSTLIILDITEI